MKKLLASTALVASTLLAAPQASMASESALSGMYFSLGGGFVLPTGKQSFAGVNVNDKKVVTPITEEKSQSGLGFFSVALGMPVADAIRAEIEFAALGQAKKEGSTAVSVLQVKTAEFSGANKVANSEKVEDNFAKADYTLKRRTNLFLANVYYDFQMEGFKPYVGVSLGAASHKFTSDDIKFSSNLDPSKTDADRVLRFEDNSKTNFAFGASLGVQIPVSDALSLDASVRYLGMGKAGSSDKFKFFDIDGKTEVTDSTAAKLATGQDVTNQTAIPLSAAGNTRKVDGDGDQKTKLLASGPLAKESSLNMFMLQVKAVIKF